METVTAVGSWLLTAAPKMFYLVSPSELALNEGDSPANYLLKYGVPMFFVLIVLEAACVAVSRWYRSMNNMKQVHEPLRMNDMLCSTTLGAFQLIFQLLCQVLGVALDAWAYRWVWERYRLFDIDSKAHVYPVFLCLFLGKDLGYYLMHRVMHEMHVMWSAHSVHHSGEDYNLPTALRQGALQPLFGFAFYFPLAILGFSPVAFNAHSELNTMYQFWFHTDVVGRLPLGLEYIINTPMAHRLHHRPPGNCNYAGVLIIWDRIFGTYEWEHTRKNLYGLAKQPNTFDALKLNVQHFERMGYIRDNDGQDAPFWYRLTARRAKHKPLWTANLSNLVKPIPEVKQDIREEGPKRPKWDGARKMNLYEYVYMIIMAISGLVLGLALLLGHHSFHWVDAAVATALLGLLMSCVGRICDMRMGEAEISMVLAAPIALLCWHIIANAPKGVVAGGLGFN